MTAPSHDPSGAGWSIAVGRRHDKFKKMFYFLEQMEARAESFSLDDLADATGYKMSSIRTYYGKRLKGLLVFERDGELTASGIGAFDEDSFIDYLTQKSSPAELDSTQAAPESAFMLNVGEQLERASSMFRVTLELYHREIDGCGLEHCVVGLAQSWDVLLRAELCRIRGMEALVTERAGLAGLVRRFFPAAQSPERRNLEWLLRLRDVDAFVLSPQLAPLFSRLLEASAMSFRRRWEAVASRPLFRSGAGALSLGVDGPVLGLDRFAECFGPALAERARAVVIELLEEEARLKSELFVVAPGRQLVLAGDDQDKVALAENTASTAALKETRERYGGAWTFSFSLMEVVQEVNRLLPYDLRLTPAAIKIIDRGYDVAREHLGALVIRAEEPGELLYSDAYVQWVVDSVLERDDWIKKAGDAVRGHASS